ncbi:EAL domain-containing protein [Spirulina sp. CCNP1310]|uniref:EAL domain-containing protein n=1 Tax=Spirulina sp. CCNP1310 TaxID=3110249 RepID=UPI002B21238C|nr:EAL domain-containing protein [Spirulina sp. CCNP1310]MEA5419927.1 EAL domain-containing protein [Spirulina sp. CCNP1310]
MPSSDFAANLPDPTPRFQPGGLSTGELFACGVGGLDHALCLLRAMPVPMVVARMADCQVGYANEHFEQMFGIEPGQARRIDDYFDPVAWQVIQQALLQYRFLPNYELHLRRQDGQRICGVVSLQMFEQGGEGWVLGVFYDTTYPRAIEQALQDHQRRLTRLNREPRQPTHRAEEESQLLQELSQVISNADHWEAALAGVVMRVCATVDCVIGEVWCPEPRGEVLVLSPVWHSRLPAAQGERFREASVDFRCGPGVGLPGRVWETQQSQWFPDVTLDPTFLRSHLAQECGIKSGFGTPIMAQGNVVAVLVFFSTRAEVRDRRLLNVMGAIATQLGAMRQRQQATEAAGAIATALEESQRQLTSLIDAVPGLFFRASSEDGWPMTYMSAGCQALTGYTVRELVDAPDHAFNRVIHPEDLGRVLATMRTHLERRQPYVLEYRIITKTRQEKWVWEKGHGVYDATGTLLAIEGFISDITEHRQTELALHSHLSELQALFAAMTDIILVLDHQGTYLKIAPTNAQLLYRPAEELLGHGIGDIFPPDIAQLFLSTIHKVLATDETHHNLEYALEMRGQTYWFSATISPTVDRTVVWVARDVTATKLAHQALAEAEQNYRSIFENALEGIFQTSPDGHYLSANPSLARIYGYSSPAELITSLTDIGHQLYVDPQQRLAFQQLMDDHGVVVGFESQVYRRDGQVIWIAENARAVRDETGQILRYEGMVMDITDQKEVEAELHRRAFYDPLTQLPNRALFRVRLNEAIARSQASDAAHPYHFAVLFLDLDRFKIVNDSLGHLVGDQLLIAIARRIEQCLRHHDMVARLGGDEFTILLDGIEDIHAATAIADRIETALHAPFELEGYQVFTGASIGIVLSRNVHPLQGVGIHQTVEELLRDADTALYQAKARGKGRYELFTPTMHQNAVSQMQLETELRQALASQAFCLYYEPILDLATRRIVGLEALPYWQHPQRGLIPALAFLTTVDETGQGLAIAQWMIQAACQQCQQWELTQPLFIHLHCSPRQLLHPEFLDQIDRVCTETAVPPSQLRLEVTEGLWSIAPEVWNERLLALSDRGLHLCIHDFSTSHATLSRLDQCPIQTLKLAPALIAEIEDNPKTAETVRILILLAHQLGMAAIAATVTTAPQVATLQDLGCEFAQGPYFGEPLTAAAMIERIRQGELRLG